MNFCCRSGFTWSCAIALLSVQLLLHITFKYRHHFWFAVTTLFSQSTVMLCRCQSLSVYVGLMCPICWLCPFPPSDAKWLYDWCQTSQPVHMLSDVDQLQHKCTHAQFQWGLTISWLTLEIKLVMLELLEPIAVRQPIMSWYDVLIGQHLGWTCNHTATVCIAVHKRGSFAEPFLELIRNSEMKIINQDITFTYI